MLAKRGDCGDPILERSKWSFLVAECRNSEGNDIFTKGFRLF
ncbi:MAG: hypothetical protein P8L18_13830 [Verrucomicrobiota bacterium]|nr:hypothetical protein [Verrucomicrobiota bacterium]